MAGYMCVAENKVGTVEKLFSLTVQGRTRLYLCAAINTFYEENTQINQTNVQFLLQ